MLCKGDVLQSSYKVKQHTTLYGLWKSKKSIEGPSMAKKTKIDESDSSSSDSSASCSDKEHSDGADDYCCGNDLVLSVINQDESILAKVRTRSW